MGVDKMTKADVRQYKYDDTMSLFQEIGPVNIHTRNSAVTGNQRDRKMILTIPKSCDSAGKYVHSRRIRRKIKNATLRISIVYTSLNKNVLLTVLSVGSRGIDVMTQIDNGQGHFLYLKASVGNTNGAPTTSVVHFLSPARAQSEATVLADDG